jgi:hypothetical protein
MNRGSRIDPEGVSRINAIVKTENVIPLDYTLSRNRFLFAYSGKIYEGNLSTIYHLNGRDDLRKFCFNSFTTGAKGTHYISFEANGAEKEFREVKNNNMSWLLHKLLQEKSRVIEVTAANFPAVYISFDTEIGLCHTEKVNLSHQSILAYSEDQEFVDSLKKSMFDDSWPDEWHNHRPPHSFIFRTKEDKCASKGFYLCLFSDVRNMTFRFAEENSEPPMRLSETIKGEKNGN